MAVVGSSLNAQPKPDVISGGTPVTASIRRLVSGTKVAVTGADSSTGPIVLGNTNRVTVYVQGVVGDTFAIDLCVEPVFAGVSDSSPLNEAASIWAPIGVATVPAGPASDILKQSIEDVSPMLRVRRISGVGAFTVRAWKET